MSKKVHKGADGERKKEYGGVVDAKLIQMEEVSKSEKRIGWWVTTGFFEACTHGGRRR
jgi:hypothetical protein